MRVFAIAVAAALVFAAATPLILNLVQKTSAQAYTTNAVRLDQQESVNDYGRAG